MTYLYRIYDVVYMI